MAYVPRWMGLAVALESAMETGASKPEAMAEVCAAIADRAVGVRVLIDKSVSDVGGKTLEGRLVGVPTQLRPEDFDWVASRPLKPWNTGPAPRDYAAMWIWKPRRIVRVDLATADVARIWGGRHSAPELQGQSSANIAAPADHAKAEINSPKATEPPPWNLWQFAWTVCPLLCKAAARFGQDDPPIAAKGYIRAEIRASRRYPSLQPWETVGLVGEEIARRKQEMRRFARHLINSEIPTRVRRKLAVGGYQVTSSGASGKRTALPQEILGGLEPDFYHSRLKGDGAEFRDVRVMPIEVSATPAAGSESSKAAPSLRPSDASLRRWYVDRIGAWPRTQKHPSADRDLEDARRAFPQNRVNRESVRLLRAELAPKDWTRFGRRKPTEA